MPSLCVFDGRESAAFTYELLFFAFRNGLGLDWISLDGKRDKGIKAAWRLQRSYEKGRSEGTARHGMAWYGVGRHGLGQSSEYVTVCILKETKLADEQGTLI